jgi:hypothetical protein
MIGASGTPPPNAAKATTSARMSKPRYPPQPRIARQRFCRMTSPVSWIPSSTILAAARSLLTRRPLGLSRSTRRSSRGTSATASAVSQAAPEMIAVNTVGTVPGNQPVRSSGPSTAAQAKLGMLVRTKKATLRLPM